jgi:DNA-binding NtrC family response regulator
MEVGMEAEYVKLKEVEKKYILEVYRRFNKNKVKTAEVLGVTVKTVYNKLRRYGVD